MTKDSVSEKAKIYRVELGNVNNSKLWRVTFEAKPDAHTTWTDTAGVVARNVDDAIAGLRQYLADPERAGRRAVATERVTITSVVCVGAYAVLVS